MAVKALTEINQIATEREYRYPEGSAEWNAWHRVKELSEVNDARTLSLDPTKKPKRKRA